MTQIIEYVLLGIGSLGIFLSIPLLFDSDESSNNASLISISIILLAIAIKYIIG